MSTANVDRFVHEYTAQGNRRFLVAEYRDGRFYAPLRTEVRRQTGCHTSVGPAYYAAAGAYTYTRRAAACARARKIWSE